MLVDSHLHLQDPVFMPDFPDVLRRARNAGVQLMICNSTSERDWDPVRELAAEIPEILPCYGIHPWYLARRAAGWEDRLSRLLEASPSAIGEAGLDRWYEDRDEKQQEEIFRSQLAIAKQHRRPIMVHCLKAWGWLERVLDEAGELPAGFVLHAYGGPVELIRPLADRGAFFSFAGNVLDERKVRMRLSLRAVPRDRLLLETDSPDLPPPEMYRVVGETVDGKRYRNEPANLAATFPAIAELRGEDPGELAEILRLNARQLLGSIPGFQLAQSLDAKADHAG
jgi:TatD DNase family protein